LVYGIHDVYIVLKNDERQQWYIDLSV
jgi:hypothetical protein